MEKNPKEIMSDKSFSIYGEQSITKFVSWPRKKNIINWSPSAHQSVATYILTFSFGLHFCSDENEYQETRFGHREKRRIYVTVGILPCLSIESYTADEDPRVFMLLNHLSCQNSS